MRWKPPPLWLWEKRRGLLWAILWKGWLSCVLYLTWSLKFQLISISLASGTVYARNFILFRLIVLTTYKSFERMIMLSTVFSGGTIRRTRLGFWERWGIEKKLHLCSAPQCNMISGKSLLLPKKGRAMQYSGWFCRGHVWRGRELECSATAGVRDTELGIALDSCSRELKNGRESCSTQTCDKDAHSILSTKTIMERRAAS